MRQLTSRPQSARDKRVATLLTIIQLGYAHWFFVNLYEAVVTVPDHLAEVNELVRVPDHLAEVNELAWTIDGCRLSSAQAARFGTTYPVSRLSSVPR